MEQKRGRTSNGCSSEGSEMDGEGPTKYQKVVISEEEPSNSLFETWSKLKQCIDIRSKWIIAHPQNPKEDLDLSLVDSGKHWPKYDPLGSVVPAEVASWEYTFVDGVVSTPGVVVPAFKEFVADYYQVSHVWYVQLVSLCNRLYITVMMPIVGAESCVCRNCGQLLP